MSEQRKIIIPKSKGHWLEMRQMDLTSTEVSALFDLSPYSTKFELWHRKKSNTQSDFKGSERTVWGERLEPAIAKGIAVDNGWTVIPKKEYIRIEEARAGSSFDFAVLEKHENETLTEKALLEIKNVDSLIFKENWLIENGEVIEAPPHIELQVQHQMWVSGIRKAYIGALVGGNKLTLLEREWDDEIISQIKTKVSQFWESIDNNEEPQPDFTKDADFVAKLYSHSEPGTVGTADEKIQELAALYSEVAAEERDAASRKKAIKAELLTRIGDKEKVLGDGFTISAGMVGPTMVEAYERKGFRNFRVTFRKKKEA